MLYVYTATLSTVVLCYCMPLQVELHPTVQWYTLPVAPQWHIVAIMKLLCEWSHACSVLLSSVVGSLLCNLQALCHLPLALVHDGLGPGIHVRQRAKEEGTKNGKKDASVMKHFGIATSSL